MAGLLSRAMSGKKLKLALLQMAVTADKAANLAKAAALVAEAARHGAGLVALPECFNSPYGTKYFEQYAEEIPGGQTVDALSAMAKSSNVYLVGGSIPERREGKLYNTSTTYSPAGELVLKYSKMHLFDIDIPGKIRFQESEVLAPGSCFGMFDVGVCKVGLGICYDMRFPEVGLWLTKQGCSVLLYPGAFNMTTGPAHWELLQRSRALDNQVYVAAVSPARDEQASYVAWGHSTVVNPWGEVIAKAGSSEEILYSDIDLDYMESVREQLPYNRQKRTDIYELTSKEQQPQQQ